VKKPASLKKFDYLYLGSIIVGFFYLVIGWDIYLREINAEIMALNGPRLEKHTITAAIAGSFIFSTAISLLLWLLISVLRLEFVKWIVATMCAFGLFALVIESVKNGVTFSQIIGVIPTLMTMAAIYMLFQPDAKAWFAAKRGD